MFISKQFGTLQFQFHAAVGFPIFSVSLKHLLIYRLLFSQFSILFLLHSQRSGISISHNDQPTLSGEKVIYC